MASSWNKLYTVGQKCAGRLYGGLLNYLVLSGTVYIILSETVWRIDVNRVSQQKSAGQRLVSRHHSIHKTDPERWNDPIPLT